jgi:anti-sigma B factor antagonist
MADAKGPLMTQQQGDVKLVWITVARILDENTIKALAAALFELADSGFRPKILLNFEQVDYLSSAVIGKLVQFHQKVAEAKGTLKMTGIKPAIKEIFKITKLDKVFQIVDDPVKAVNSFKSEGGIVR